MILNFVKFEIFICFLQKLDNYTVFLRNKIGGYFIVGLEIDNKLLFWFELVLFSFFFDWMRKWVRELSKLFEISSWLVYSGCYWFGDSGCW